MTSFDNRNNKNKGFTLVELLAVIAIIGVILAIAIFSVNTIFKTSRDKASEIDLESIKNSAVSYVNENYLGDMYWVDEGEYEYSCVPILELVNKGYLKENEIDEYKEEWQFIKVNRDKGNKTIISEDSGESYCSYGTSDGGVIFDSTTKTTTSIKLQAHCEDTSKGVKGISFAFSDKQYSNQMVTLNNDGKYIAEFNQLESNKEYTIKARCNYTDGTYSGDTTETVSTGWMDYFFSLPDGNKTNFNEEKGKVYKKVEVKFRSSDVSTFSYYFKSTSSYTFSNINISVLECGNGSMPTKCALYNVTEDGYEGIKLRKGYWYKVDNNDKETSVVLDVYDSGNILAMGHDGGNYLDFKSTQITFDSSPYVVLNISHSSSQFSYDSTGFLGGDNEVDFYTNNWMSMPKISFQVFGGSKTKSYVYYSNSTENYNNRGSYNTSNIVSGYNGKTTCNEKDKCYIDADKFTKGGMQEFGIEVVNTFNGKKTIIRVRVNIDKKAPVISVINKNGDSWTNKDIEVEINYGDDHSGINAGSLQWKDNASSTSYKPLNNAGTTLAKDTWSGEGDRVGTYKICDNAGNCAEASTTIKIDKSGPILNITNSSGGKWTSSNITVTLNFSDSGGSGINASSLQWKDNANNTSYSTLSNSSTTSKSDTWKDEGNRIGTYKICDNAGNCTEASTTIKIDKSGPTAPTTMEYVFGDWSRYTRGSWTNKDVYAANTSSSKGPSGSTDSLSGVAKYQISSNGSDWVDYSYSSSSSMYRFSTSGTHVRYFRACDAVGNCGSYISRTALIDKSAPTLNITNSSGGSWTSGNVTITLSFSDSGGSGINASSLQRKDNVSSTSYSTLSNSSTTSKSDTWSNEGNRSVTYKICDNAGNCTEKSTNVKIDKSAPSKPTITNPTNGNWTNNDFSLTLTSSDAGSGIAYYQYSYSSSATTTGDNANTQWKTYSNSASNTFTTTPFSAERNQNVYVRACDNVGKCSDASSTMIKIDKTAPVVNVSIKNEAGSTINTAANYQGSGTINYNNGNWSNSFPTIYFTVNDKSSTELSVYYNSGYTYSNRTSYSTSNIMNKTWDSAGNATSRWDKVSDTSGNFTIGSGGKRQLAIYVKDSAGNGTTVVVNADLDNESPSCSYTAVSSSSYGATANISCNDSGSGCSSGTGNKSGLTGSNYYYVYDAAGNYASCYVRVGADYNCTTYKRCASAGCASTTVATTKNVIYACSSACSGYYSYSTETVYTGYSSYHCSQYGLNWNGADCWYYKCSCKSCSYYKRSSSCGCESGYYIYYVY